MNNLKAVVAGHICLDLIPDLSSLKNTEDDRFIIPGRLLRIGPASVALGGAVANTGIALARLGTEVTLMGKIGDDLLGETILSALHAQGMPLLDYQTGMIHAPGETSSYTVVISPPNTDRCFLHCSGANDTFSPADLDTTQFEGVKLLHFGYPTLMREIYSEPKAFSEKLAEIRAKGTLISLDVTMPDPNGPEGKVDWRRWFEQVLPNVDIFLPSLEETLFMLNRPLFEEMMRRLHRAVPAPGESLNPVNFIEFREIDELADDLLSFGVEVAGIKLGDQGIYLRTSASPRRVTEHMTQNVAPQWSERKLLATCYEVPVAGTTGSGDCTIAGFLTALLRGWTPKEALRFAAAVGACNVQKADATSGIPTLEEVQERAQTWTFKENRLNPEEVGGELA